MADKVLLSFKTEKESKISDLMYSEIAKSGLETKWNALKANAPVG